MTGSDTTTRKPAPLWALAIGAAVAAGCSVLLVRLLGDQVRALALGAPDSRLQLLLPLAFGEGLSALAVWSVLRATFNPSWKRRRGALYAWLAVLLAASVMSGGFALVLGINHARGEADRAAAQIERLELAAVDSAGAGFPEEADSRLVTAAFDEIRSWADPIRDVREISISRAPDGEWEAVCGQVTFGKGQWAGFVTHRIGEGRPRTALEQDGFDEARRKACRPIVDRYVGIEGVDVAAAIAAMKALGCSDLDINYWEAEKAYCHGQIVRPEP